MSDLTFNPEQKAKLTQVINEGMQVLSEVDVLNEGLNETIKAVAEEMQIKPGILKKAVKTAHKASYNQVQQDHEELTTILETVGRTL